MLHSVVGTISASEVDDKILQAKDPIALDFYQASCAPCRALEPRLERAVRSYAGRIPVYRVDVDRDPGVAERFTVMNLPTILFLREGREVERLDGLITQDDLRGAFERYARGRGES